MTVTEYRKKNPNCNYCKHNIERFDYCQATGEKKSKRTAKKCPCYVAYSWRYENEERSDNNAE